MTNTDYDEIDRLTKELEPYAILEDTEIGEACSHLIQLAGYSDYLSEEFMAALRVELEDQLTNFQENATIVEHVETFTRPVRYINWD